MSDLVICVVHHSNEEFLENLIKSIENSEKNFSYKIAIIDNNTNTNFISLLKKKYKNIETNFSSSINGYAYNQNFLLKKNYKQYKFSLVINDDTIFNDKLSLQKLYDFMLQNHMVAAASPQILNKDLTAQPVYGPIGTYLSHTIRLTMLSKIINKKIIRYINTKNYGGIFPKFIRSYFEAHILKNENISVTKVSGCCMIINNNLLDNIGFFDDLNFDMYCDDTDWSYRAGKLNYPLFKVGNASLIHYGGESNYPGMVLRKEKTILKYLKKHFPNFIYIRLYSLVLFFHSMLMILIYLIKSFKNYKNVFFSFEYLKLTIISIYYFIFSINVK